MKEFPWKLLQTKAAFVAVIVGAILNRSWSGEAPARIDSNPRLVRKVDFGEYGSRHIRFGDLDGDGLPEIVLVQANPSTAYITCLTAIDLEGRILWQVGSPDVRNSYYKGENLQIYDLDHDGHNEVIYNSDEKTAITILDGKTGTIKKRVQLAGKYSKYDTILFVDFSGRGYPQEVFLADAFSNGFSIFDQNFKQLWSKQDSHIGHYPINYDFDGDGKDELLCGYALYDHNGRELWNHREFPEHNDATYIGDMDGDGHAEIAMATSVDAVLLDEAGSILFRKTMNHCQHALIGKFRQDLPGKQVVFVSREQKKERAEFGFAKLSMFTKSGQLLWSKETEENLWVAAALVVDSWTGNSNENFVAMEERGFSPPALLDGEGHEIATFPFPPAILERGEGRFVSAQERSGPGGRKLYDEYHLDHLDCYGDEREEILVYNQKALYIYTNAALWQKARLYNHNYFPGRR